MGGSHSIQMNENGIFIQKGNGNIQMTDKGILYKKGMTI